MNHSPRKTAPEVRSGRVQKKNNWEETPDYFIAEQPELVIDRKRPGEGFRHLLSHADIRRFISIVPDWEKHSQGLNGIVLATGRRGYFGCYDPGVISVGAWVDEMVIYLPDQYYEHDVAFFDCFSVPRVPDRNGWWQLDFTEETARAFLLLSVFLHELGHHNDYMNTRRRENANRGEPHANEFALELGLKLWPSYQKAFRI